MMEETGAWVASFPSFRSAREAGLPSISAQGILLQHNRLTYLRRKDLDIGDFDWQAELGVSHFGIDALP
jgi:hypothetical protein